MITMPSVERIFFKVLFDSPQEEFIADPIELHKAFYDLYRENPGEMEAFDFVIRGNPYSAKLEEVIFYYQLCGIVQRHGSRFINYTIDRDKLNKIKETEAYPGDITSLKLKKPESIKVIFGKDNNQNEMAGRTD